MPEARQKIAVLKARRYTRYKLFKYKVRVRSTRSPDAFKGYESSINSCSSDGYIEKVSNDQHSFEKVAVYQTDGVVIFDSSLTMIKSLALALLLVLPPHLAEGYSSPGTTDFRTVDLMSVGPSQLAVLDGGEWASVQVALKEEKLLPKSTRNGYMTIITGRNGENQRVVGMQCPGSRNSVYEDSVAVIPRKVSEEDAIATYIVSLSSVHTTLPKAEQVGGSADSVIAGKAVVLGSSELACFAGEALAAMGIDVSLVSPGSPKVKKSVGKSEFDCFAFFCASF